MRPLFSCDIKTCTCMSEKAVFGLFTLGLLMQVFHGQSMENRQIRKEKFKSRKKIFVSGKCLKSQGFLWNSDVHIVLLQSEMKLYSVSK